MQLMGTGESGANGAHVQSHASRESSHEHENVTHRKQSMVGKLAQEMSLAEILSQNETKLKLSAELSNISYSGN